MNRDFEVRQLLRAYPREAVAPITAFAALLKTDLESKQALRLIAEDELSTVNWLRDVCAALAESRSATPPREPAA
jgi:hypothetical protein